MISIIKSLDQFQAFNIFEDADNHLGFFCFFNTVSIWSE